MTEHHVKLLRRFGVERLVLAFDADAAGQAAAARVYEWEQAHGVDVTVAKLPDGRDPGELAEEDPQALADAVRDAIPLMEFRLGRVFDSADLDTPEHRARTAELGVSMIAEHPSDLVRDQYLVEVADRCRVNVEQLRHHLANPLPLTDPPRERRRRSESDVDHTPLANEPPEEAPHYGDDGESAGAPSPAATRTEDEALRLYLLDQAVLTPYMRGYLFRSPLHRSAVEGLLEHGDLHRAIAAADPNVADLLRGASVTEPLSESLETVAMLTDRATARVLDSLRRDAIGPDAASYVESIAWLKHRVEDLRDSTTRQKALDQLLPWLDEHGIGRLADG